MLAATFRCARRYLRGGRRGAGLGRGGCAPRQLRCTVTASLPLRESFPHLSCAPRVLAAAPASSEFCNACTPPASLGSLCTFLSSSYSLSAPVHFSCLPRHSPHIPLHLPVSSLNHLRATAAPARLDIPCIPVLHTFPSSCISALPPYCVPIPKPSICPAAERSPWSPPAPQSPHHKEPVLPLPAPTPRDGIFLSEGMSSQRTRRSSPTDAAPAFTAVDCAPKVCRWGAALGMAFTPPWVECTKLEKNL